MRKFIRSLVPAVCFVLSGCGATVTAENVELAKLFCEHHEGLVSIEVEEVMFIGDEAGDVVLCKDGESARIMDIRRSVKAAGVQIEPTRYKQPTI